jgi:hypothetical protein
MRSVAGIGGFGTGLILLVGGLLLKNSQSHMLAECNSGLGQLGQLFDPNAASSCSSSQDLSSLATAGIWIGVIMLIVGIGGGVLALVGVGVLATTQKKPGTAPRRAATAVPGASASLAAPPIRPTPTPTSTDGQIVASQQFFTGGDTPTPGVRNA